MTFTKHTGLKVSPFELHHGINLKTELTNLVRDNKSHLSNWKTMKLSVPLKQIPFYVVRNEKGEVTDHSKWLEKERFHAVHPTSRRKESRQNQFVETSNTRTHFWTGVVRKNSWKGGIKNNQKLPSTVPNTRSVQQTIKFYIGN